MSSLVYLLRKTIKNWFCELKKNPGRLVLVLFVVAALVLVFVSTLFTDPSELVMERRDIGELYGIIFALYLLIFLMTAYNGFSSGASFYSMADVNILFQTPISSKRVLVYGLVKQATLSLAVGFFILFQYAWVHQLYGVDLLGLIYILIGYGVTMFCGQLVSMIVYSLTSGNDQLQKRLRFVLFFLAIVVAVYLASPLLEQPSDLLGSVVAQVNTAPITYIPVAGWLKLAMEGCLTGNPLAVLLGFGVTAAFILLLLTILLKSRADFYEDVLQATEVSFTAITAKKENNTVDVVPKKVKVGKTGLGKGWGETAFYYKSKLENRRRKVFLLDSLSMTFMLVTIFMSIILKEEGILFVFFFSVYMQLFSASSGGFAKELLLPYIYMVPEKPFKKLLILMLNSMQKILFESVLLFVIVGVIMQASVLEVVCCIVARFGFGMLFTSSLVLTERILGGSTSKALIMSFYFLGDLIALAPGIVIGVVVNMAIAPTMMLPILLGCSFVWNLIIAGLFTFLSRNMLLYAEVNNR